MTAEEVKNLDDALKDKLRTVVATDAVQTHFNRIKWDFSSHARVLLWREPRKGLPLAPIGPRALR